jgi:hypothetical protein
VLIDQGQRWQWKIFQAAALGFVILALCIGVAGYGPLVRGHVVGFCSAQFIAMPNLFPGLTLCTSFHTPAVRMAPAMTSADPRQWYGHNNNKIFML